MNEQNNKICGRVCVEMIGRLTSPLSVGSGEQEYSDSDIILNAQNIPYIPGSSLAGVLRDYSNAMAPVSDVNELFGKPRKDEPGGMNDRQSRIIIYDAMIAQAQTGIRDGVKLTENKTASSMGKYKLQFVERNASVKIRIEIIEREKNVKAFGNIKDLWKRDLQWVQLWMNGFNNGEIRLGARSRRGFGKMEISRLNLRKFDMRDKDTYMRWLDWSWDQADAFESWEGREVFFQAKKMKAKRLEHCLELPLHIPYTLLVREYNAVAEPDGKIADYGQLTVGARGTQAFIPGSSWAGAFRSQIAKIVRELGHLSDWEDAQKRLDPLFGTWTNTLEKRKDLIASKLIFEDTIVEGGHGLPTARIAIDRFTGGTVQGALYKENLWAGGNVLLRIRWPKGETGIGDKVICGVLLWAIRDLQHGILAVGGETSAGKGIFEPQKPDFGILKDGMALSEIEQSAYMQAAALWVQKSGNDLDVEGGQDGEV